MPTKWSRTLIPTSRQVPGDAEVPSHQLMIRAGLIRKLGAGVYDYLPLGLRALHKVMAIVREEMDRAGALEVLLPTLQPIELWEQTGRRDIYGPELFVIADRHAHEHALGPTHEEVITELVRAYIESYRQLPITLYQIQSKFRDEIRPRFGVLRSREFQMKDAYSFDLTVEGLEASYQAMYDAYCRIFERCGLPYEVVEAESGPIGGSSSHEFMVPSPTGEDTILKSDKGNYAANVEKCETAPRADSADGPPTGELETVHTPGCPTIEDVCRFMKVKPAHMLKTLVCGGGDDGWVVAVVRGDHDLNSSKLRTIVGAPVDLADEVAARAAGFEIGFVGPHVAAGRDDVRVVVDHDAMQAKFWATGANQADHHVKHFNWQRDLVGAAKSPPVVADIRSAVDGDPSPRDDGGVLRLTRGIEVGHVFKLGTKYTESMGFEVLDESNQRRPVIMGCYGIGINRILAAAIERQVEGDAKRQGHDDDGVIWPVAIAPYSVLITTIRYEGAVQEAADRLAAEIEAAGHDVLIDDRADRPGVKFKDADLVGIPLRITIGEKGLADGHVEVKPRRADKAETVPVGEAARRAVECLRDL
ncbi:MAG: proline--tRNA ligase [Phycisphaeraceae bacterium]|nr:proline--tRNA ligase [Phycisphaeraceae bacterium]